MFRCLPFLCLLFQAAASWAQVVPLPNDECTSAIAVGIGVNPGAPSGSNALFTSIGATASAGSPVCVTGPALDVWFSYTANATGAINVRTCTPSGFGFSSLIDTVLSVFEASTCPPTVMIGCDDDACVSLSSVTVSVTSGTTYFIRVAGFAGATGTFRVSVLPVVPPITNDECTSPVALALGTNGLFTNATATNSPGAAASCGLFASPGHKDLWFSYIPACSGPINVNTGCNGFDTILTAYASCGGPELACNDQATGCGSSSSVTFPGTAGTPYLIRVASWSSTFTGIFNVNVASAASLTLGFSSPLGPGSIQVDLSGGTPLGSYFLVLTFFAGSFPNGWLYGVDLPFAELPGLLNTGPPFLGGLDACGHHTIGPIGGVGFLSGIPMYAVALGLSPGSAVPTVSSTPVTYTIP